jgi:hypothetical protein
MSVSIVILKRALCLLLIMVCTEEAHEAQRRLHRYTEEATNTFGFSIAEALLNYPHNTALQTGSSSPSGPPTQQRTIPWIKVLENSSQRLSIIS